MLTVEHHGWHEARARFAAEWRGLLARGDLNPSLGPEWIEAIATAHGRVGDLRVAVASEGSEIVGVLPYFIRRARMLGLPMTVVELAGNLVSYRHELVAPGREADFLSACLASLEPTWHVFAAHHVVAGTPIAAALEEACALMGRSLVRYPGETSPYLTIDMGWEEYLATKSRNFKANLRRKERGLREAGRLEERWHLAPRDVAELTEVMMEVESHSWKVAAGIAVSQSPTEQRYYRELLPYLADSGMLFNNALFLDGRPVAYHLCYFANGRIGNLKTSFHDDYKALSPGAVVIARAIQRAFEEGATVFDFHGETQRHKRQWSEEAHRHENLYCFSGRLRSRTVALLKRGLQRLRRKAAPDAGS